MTRAIASGLLWALCLGVAGCDVSMSGPMGGSADGGSGNGHPATGGTPGSAITYGTDGNGDPKTDDCTTQVKPGDTINSAIGSATSGAVICVAAGDYSTQTVNLTQAGVTVRATGQAKIKNALLSGDNTTLDGFTIVGGIYQNPNEGILFAGNGQKVLNNLVNGRQLFYGIRCTMGKCNSALVSGNTVTGIQHYGMFIDDGTGTVVEKNDVYDVYSDKADDDVDGIRFWGKNTIFRYNYVHDINQFKSALFSDGDTPHTDCFQTYNNGTQSTGVIIENNYCVRVSRQCLIVQNDSAKTYELQNITFRNNFCETFDSQSINIGSINGLNLENNMIISGFRLQIISFENQGNGIDNANALVQDNILIRTTSGATTYERIGTPNDKDVNNLESLDTSFFTDDATFAAEKQTFSPLNPADFTLYKAYAAKLGTTADKGTSRTNNNATTDIDGNPRIQNGTIDIGPWESGGSAQ